MEFRFTDHALDEILKRRIPKALVKRTLEEPEQIVAGRRGRKVYQSRHELDGRTYLIRVIVDVLDSPPAVMTVYKSSKILKYWSEE